MKVELAAPRGSADKSDTWSEDRVVELSRRWDNGESAGEIGRAMGLTRNAIIGKAHRLGLPTRKRVRGEVKPRRPRVLGQSTRKRKVVAFPGAAVLVGDGVRMREIDIPTRNVELIDLKHNECRWPIGDGPYTFCGCATRDGVTYCDGHDKLAHNRYVDDAIVSTTTNAA